MYFVFIRQINRQKRYKNMHCTTHSTSSLGVYGILNVIFLLAPCGVTGQQLSIDELITNVANSGETFDVSNPSDSSNGMVRVESDMLYSIPEWNDIQAHGSRKKRAASNKNGFEGGYRWTNNVVPYEYARRHFSIRDIKRIESGLSEWRRYTCLQFRKASGSDKNKILFQNSKLCASRLGMVGGTQDIELSPNCRKDGIIMHEIGHSLGLHHEHNRPDRDTYVQIIRKNISKDKYRSFQKRSWRQIENLGIPYDYESIMHYSSKTFSANGGITIKTVDPLYQNVIGHQKHLSFRDIKTVNIMYNCKRAQSNCTRTDSDCSGEGFIGKDCKCWCPGSPYKICSDGTVLGVNKCKDLYGFIYCYPLAKRGYCQSEHARAMLARCMKSCGICFITDRVALTRILDSATTRAVGPGARNGTTA